MGEVIYQNRNFKWINILSGDYAKIPETMKSVHLKGFQVESPEKEGHLPKFEFQHNYNYSLIRFYKKSEHPYTNIVREFSKKISIYQGKNFLLTMHHDEVPFFGEILEKLPKLDAQGDMETFELFKIIFKNNTHTFLTPAEEISQSIDVFEDRLFEDERSKIDLRRVYTLKREASACVKILMLNREVLRSQRALFPDEQLFKEMENYNELMYQLHSQNNEDLNNLFELVTSLSDMRANRVMKVLTVFAAFFLPLTFISGVYGMNFVNMPELDLKYSYFAILGFMLLIVITIFIWFRKEKFF